MGLTIQKSTGETPVVRVMMRRFFVVVVWLGVMMSAGVVCAQLPQARLNSIIPPGGKIGADVEITASGTDLDEPSGLRDRKSVV